MSNPGLLQGVSLYKPVILAGYNAILPVFSGTYTDENGSSFTVQLRGAFSTERRAVPNVVVSFQPGQTTLFSGQGIVDYDSVTGMYLYGAYIFEGRLKYTMKGRNEAEREWLIDTLATALTGLVFTSASSPVFVNNNFVSYLGSQGIIVKGWDAPEYPQPILNDEASSRPEGQVYECTIPLIVDVSLQWEMPGFSSTQATLTNSGSIATNPPFRTPWVPNPTNPTGTSTIFGHYP